MIQRRSGRGGRLLLGYGEQALQVGLQLVIQLLEVSHLLLVLLFVQLPALRLPLLDRRALPRQLLRLALQVLDFRMQMLDLRRGEAVRASWGTRTRRRTAGAASAGRTASAAHLGLHLCLLLLGHERLAHAERDAGLVERLVGGDGHADLVADPEQQQAALRAVDGDLANQLVWSDREGPQCEDMSNRTRRPRMKRTKALGIELLANRADPRLPGLPLLKLLVQCFLQIDHVQAGGRCAGHILHPQLPVLRPLAGARVGGASAGPARDRGQGDAMKSTVRGAGRPKSPLNAPWRQDAVQDVARL